MTKIIKITTLALIAILSFASCSREDDIDEIFDGKTWYMNGGKINGLKLNAEIKNFYTEADGNAYFIQFNGSTFQGCLASGATFSGTWEANGKNHSIKFIIKNKPDMSSPFDKQIFSIITSANSYESGADFLFLNKDKDNSIYFANKRNKIYN